MTRPVSTDATVLFVAYGSGHIQMVVPVAQALARRHGVRPVVLALTTAADVARRAGLEVLQFKDFVQAGDADALQLGRRLMQDLAGPVADAEETAAYLGLSMADLVHERGDAAAWEAYRAFGRQAFLPRRTLQRILQRVAPKLVVVTNSPRAERAAALEARRLGIPAVCMVDLFAIDEVQWIGAPAYADQVCVLNDSVKDFLVAAGRSPGQITVTGNPGFDALRSPAVRDAGRQMRKRIGWPGCRVVLWPQQVEPAQHPFDGRPGDPTLPRRALDAIVQWVQARDDVLLCVRPRAGEHAPVLPADRRVIVTGQDVALPALLHAADVVVTLSSTVGLEGHLAGCRLVQVTGSVFDHAMPLARYGMADAQVDVESIHTALNRWTRAPRRAEIDGHASATEQVVAVIDRFL